MLDVVRSRARRVSRAYANGRRRPLGGYLATMGTYAGVVSALAGLARATGRTLPERPATQDVVLISIATHKLSRLLTKESVTSPLRAPFTRYEGVGGPAELHEEVRGEGVAHAVGELVTCPFCVGVWVATGLSAGLVFAPRLTRLVAATFTAVAASDALQFGYAAAQQLPGRVSGD
jgi:hypothetical protein